MWPKGSLKGNKGFPSWCGLVCPLPPVVSRTGHRSKPTSLPAQGSHPPTPQSCGVSECLPHKIEGTFLEVSLLCGVTTEQERRSWSESNHHIIQACYGLWFAQKTATISDRGIGPVHLQKPDHTAQSFRAAFPSLTSRRMEPLISQ